MRAQLLHLSGPQRGRTVTYEARRVRIGSAPDRDAVLESPVVAQKHAQIEFVEEQCQFYLRKVDGQTFVNGTEVEEVILQDGDQIELGSGGPVVRFRIYVPAGAVCKPVRRMLADARAVAKVSGGAAATQTLTRDLFTQATPHLKIGFPLAVIAGAFLAGWLGGWLGGRPQGVSREELEALREAQKQTQANTVPPAEMEALRKAQQEQQLALARLVRANAVIARIQRDSSRGVCLLHGVFRLKMTDGTWFEPDAEPFEVEYTGSGFLATAAGHVITNRHVVRPWEEMGPVMRLVERGAEPTFVRFTATFPGKPSVDVPVASIATRADTLDVAVVQLPVAAIEGVPVLPMHDGALDPDDRRAIVVGYPTGLSAMLARADASMVEGLQTRGATMAEAITELAAAGQIAPIITDGVLSNVQERLLGYSAATTHGGSGGPVLDSNGEVIGVNYAILLEFGGSNFGVPIRFARELLKP